MAAAATSGTWNWQPALAEFLLDAFARIQIYAPAIEDQHIIEATRSMNIMLLDWGNRGVNLWEVDQITIPLKPDVATYTLPANTLNMFATFIRQFTPGAMLSLGNALTVAVTHSGDPVVTAAGEPAILHPSSGVFSTVEGSQTVTMFWQNHGQAVGNPIFLICPITAGPMTLQGTLIVTRVLDLNHLQFLAPNPAPVTRNGVGGTPLFVTKSGQKQVTVILAGHGLAVGDSFQVEIPTVVGGVTLFGAYLITSELAANYSFTFDAASAANANAVAFENSGQIAIETQATARVQQDIIIWPLGREDYAALPNKLATGRPTTFWFDRIVPPTVTVWPVPPLGSNYGLISYRTRDIQDAIPVGNQILDVPRRFYAAFVADLTAYLAEKFRPEMFAEKSQAALAAWERASIEDREKVSSYLIPDMSGYFR